MLSLDALFDRVQDRLRGINTWDDLQHVGRSNLERLIDLAREGVDAALADGDGDDARTRAAGIHHLSELLEKERAQYPMLPRIRVELFHVGGRVAIFLGDSPGALVGGWARATVTRVAKSFRPEWANARANSGYFWEVTATADHELFPGERTVRFSTTEPRVLRLSDVPPLVTAPAAFRRIFTANSWRDWNPLWCIDHEVAIDANRIDFTRWLAELGALAA